MGGKKKQSKKKASKNAPSGIKTNKTKLSKKHIEEEEVLSELRMRIRSLLACMQGVAPDGSPFVTKGHPLATLLESIYALIEKLILVQRSLILDKLQNSEKVEVKTRNTVVVDRDSPEKWEAFSKWLEHCECHPKLQNFPIEIRKINESKNGYGLFATRNIGYDEQILEIPNSAMMTPYWNHMHLANNESTPKPPPYDAKNISLQDKGLQQLSLITFLANEKWRGSKSPYHDYISILPNSYTTPLYWSLDGLKTLHSTPHLKRAVAQTVLTMWDYLCVRDQLEKFHEEEFNKTEVLPTTPDFSYELFRWATATVQTRQNMIPFVNQSDMALDKNSVQDALALVPLWDLINHDDCGKACSSEVILECSDSEIQSQQQAYLRCRTPKAMNCDGEICFRCGEEIKMYYGKRSNVQLLFQSGFVFCDTLCDADTSKNKKYSENIVNLNNSDEFVLRLALPFAHKDKDLHRVREMIAARYGFKLYVNQNCFHDGISCAQIASKHANVTNNSETDQIRESMEDELVQNSTLMTEFTLSPLDPDPLEFERAVLLCIADKEELNYLLRNSHGNSGLDKEYGHRTPLPIKTKHIAFLKDIIEAQLDLQKRLSGAYKQKTNTDKGDVWIKLDNARDLSQELLVCEGTTLKKWFKKCLNRSLNID